MHYSCEAIILCCCKSLVTNSGLFQLCLTSWNKFSLQSVNELLNETKVFLFASNLLVHLETYSSLYFRPGQIQMQDYQPWDETEDTAWLQAVMIWLLSYYFLTFKFQQILYCIVTIKYCFIAGLKTRFWKSIPVSFGGFRGCWVILMSTAKKFSYQVNA